LMEFLLPLAMRESSDLWLHQIVRSGVILNDQILTRHMEDIEDRSVLSMTSMMIKFEKLEFGSAECILTVSEMLSMIGSSTRISSKDVRTKISVLKILAKSLVSELPLLPSWDELSSSSSSLNKKNNRVSVVDAVVESASALGETVEIFIPFVVDEWKKLKEEDDNDDKNASSSLLLDIRLLAESLFMASKYCLECCQRAALFLTNSEKKKGDLSAIVLSGARLHYATGSVLEFFQEEVIEAIPVRNAEALELTRRAFMSQCAAVHANLKALKKMKLLDRSLVTLLYALKVHKNTSIADQQTTDVERTEEEVDGKIINERKRKYGFSIYTTTTQAKDAQQLNDATHPLDGGKESGVDGDRTGGEGKKNEANDDGNGESQQQKRRKVLRKKRSKKRRNRFNNPYLEAVREHEGDDSGDDDDDLADFIVCKPGRDYRQVFGLT